MRLDLDFLVVQFAGAELAAERVARRRTGARADQRIEHAFLGSHFGASLHILAATLTAIPDIPVLGLVLVLSVDWFMGIARALGNLIGNCVATVVVAAWEKDIDKVQARKVLDGKVEVDLDEHAEDLAPLQPQHT